MASIEERVESLLKEKIEAIGYELYDVEYSKEGKNYFLRIFIDNSVKYTDNEHGIVKISANVKKDYAEILIEDNGIGIPKK